MKNEPREAQEPLDNLAASIAIDPSYTSNPFAYLDTLNEAQKTAVTFPNDIPLQILAGPGSGKTRVLTARVAYLVHHYSLYPWEITAVTFTNKAAGEMRKRLEVLLGKEVAKKLVLGTFHATCATYLRKYGSVIGLPKSFTITDSDDTKKLIGSFYKLYKSDPESIDITIKGKEIVSEISRAKAKEETSEGMMKRAKRLGEKGEVLAVIAEIYKQYEESLRKSEALDFDDLLLFGLKLFRTAPNILQKCKHILVDEFQDTNSTQYELLKLFAKAHGNVTIVGDPDQSIYGWRSAEVENLNHMKRDFPNTSCVYLEENYRSTGAILAAAHAVVSQDRFRVPKALKASHEMGLPVTLKRCNTGPSEAIFIADEIKRLIAYSGGMLGHGDFAILLRYNALSRPIEQALQRGSIPSRLIGGHKFFERVEIKDLLAYLQLVDNPNYQPAFIRVVNVPKRAIGEKSVQDLLSAARSRDICALELAERIVSGEDLLFVKPSTKTGLVRFVEVVHDLRDKALKGMAVADLITLLMEQIDYKEHLQKTHEDFDSRWKNVQELISYAVIVSQERHNVLDLPDAEGLSPGGDDFPGFRSARDVPVGESVENAKEQDPPVHPFFRQNSDASAATRNGNQKKASSRSASGTNNSDVISIADSDDEGLTPLSEDGTDKAVITLAVDRAVNGQKSMQRDQFNLTPLRVFLEESMLSTDTESKSEQDDRPKVTISTVHAAKGLEWPVVFLPCMENGTYPMHRKTEDEDISEERRLLYVAMTRAQAALILSHSKKRMLGRDEKERHLSLFIDTVQKSPPELLSPEIATISPESRVSLSVVLGRAPVEESETQNLITAHDAERRRKTISEFGSTIPWFNSKGKEKRARDYWESETDDYKLPSLAPGEDDDLVRVPIVNNAEIREGFVSAKAKLQLSPGRNRVSSKSSQASPAHKLERQPPDRKAIQIATKMEYQEPLPFNFGPVADMNAPEFKPTAISARTQQLSEDSMKSLGLPPPIASLNSAPPPTQAVSTAGIATFQRSSNSSLAFMKNLGASDIGGASSGSATKPIIDPNVGSTSYQLPTLTPQMQSMLNTTKPGGGNKRLGMAGRPAPWGTKKVKRE